MSTLRRLMPALLILALGAKISAAEQAPPVVVSGKLDLTHWQPEAHPVLSLDGDWFFKAGEFADPAQPFVWNTLLHLPGFWNDQKLSSQGFATYVLQIRRKPGREIFAIHTIDMESAYALYANGERIGGNGQVGTSKADEVPAWQPRVWSFAAEGDIHLVLHVSNFHHRLGGVWKGMHFGKQGDLQDRQNRSIAIELFLSGSLLMIAIYHMLIFFLRRDERGFLLLGVLCLLMALRGVVTGERFLMTMMPHLPWHWLVRFDYLTIPLALVATHWYFMLVYRPYYHRFAFYALLVIMVPCVLAESLLEPMVFSHLISVHSASIALWSSYALFVNVLAFRHKLPGAGVLLIGWVIAIATFLNDIVYIHAEAHTGYLFAAGLYAFVLTQSYYLAMRYARAFTLSEVLARRMESLLGLTRNLNRSGKRDTAVWTAADEICRVTGTNEEPVAYIRMADSRLFRRIRRDGQSEGVSPELSEALAVSDAMTVVGKALRIPIRYAGRTLCVLDIPGAITNEISQIQYLEGILESLALALENIYSAERHALASVGQAASEIVHDINHHCQIIAHYAGTARADGNATEALNGIQREAGFMKNLALDILDYAREKIIVHPQKHSLSEIEKTIATDLTELFRGKQIEFSMVGAAQGEFRIDLERFRRVVMNLARNADQAMQNTGKFSVRIERQADIYCFLFEDTGPGIDPKIKDRLFEPFASGGRGSGLGLAVVKRIVGAHGGEVHASSEAGKGCRFMIELPA